MSPRSIRRMPGRDINPIFAEMAIYEQLDPQLPPKKRERIARQQAEALYLYSDKLDNRHHGFFHSHRPKRRPN